MHNSRGCLWGNRAGRRPETTEMFAIYVVAMVS